MTETAATIFPSLEGVDRLTRDLIKSIRDGGMSKNDVRYAVDSYYQLQDFRKALGNQELQAETQAEPHNLTSWMFKNMHTLEKQIVRAMEAHATTSEPGRWLMAQTGIGPVLAAGLLAYIDIERAPTAGHIWRFAGLDPTQKWNKGEKRPWNASLKTLCWKIGESFVKVSGREDAYYAQIYKQRKELETARNEAGLFASQAAEGAARVGKTTEAYGHYITGKLPPGHIHARAKRYAVKLFLSHLHEVMYRDVYGTPPPLPYPIAMQNHAHKIEVPVVLVS